MTRYAPALAVAVWAAIFFVGGALDGSRLWWSTGAILAGVALVLFELGKWGRV